MPPGATGRDYAAAFQRVVLPALKQFDPDVVFVSSGFDAHEADPLGGMALRDEDFGAFARATQQLTQVLKKPRLGVVLEGGYDLGALERASRAVAEALLGKTYELDEGPVSASVERVIDRTRSALAGHFEF
jgi:acetoin utilization deacetylase AcuC-like enzyme